jgi:hypothetical protein
VLLFLILIHNARDGKAGAVKLIGASVSLSP